MEEIIVKVEIPEGYQNKIKMVMERTLREFLEEFEFSLAKEILKESEFTIEHAKELGREVNLIAAKKHA